MPPTLSLSMMRFESGPMMSEESENMETASGVVCEAVRPLEADLMLSLVHEPDPIVLGLYRESEPARLAG